jgi:hypothetical protein
MCTGTVLINCVRGGGGCSYWKVRKAPSPVCLKLKNPARILRQPLSILNYLQTKLKTMDLNVDSNPDPTEPDQQHCQPTTSLVSIIKQGEQMKLFKLSTLYVLVPVPQTHNLHQMRQ